jgi:4'-phosphopantetheinyl transferase
MSEIRALAVLPTLLNGQIHVWPVLLRASDDDVARSEASLSPRERQRGDAFRFPQLRRKFVLTHGSLRALLALYLEISAEDIHVGMESGGKPCLRSPDSDIRFNQSASGELAVFAFSLGLELGVDIEAWRTIPGLESLSSRFFSREEADDILKLPIEHRAGAFLTAWTRKEAYAKALGRGLRVPFDQFRVTLRPSDEPRIVHIGGDRLAARSWQIHDFRPADGYLGALAYQGSGIEVQVHATMTAADLLGPCVATRCG